MLIRLAEWKRNVFDYRESRPERPHAICTSGKMASSMKMLL